MIRNKHTPLPLHHGGPVGNGTGINAALDKGLNLVGLAATKTGSGEKERAYVVKQNSVLKGLLCIVVLAAVVLIVVFSTVLELKVARRGLVLSEAVHHKKEHHDHEEILRRSLELQEALEATIEETSLVDEFRAFFEKSVGTSDDKVDKLFQDANVPAGVIEKAKGLQRDFVKSVEVRLGKILNRFHKRAAEARQQVVQLAKMMGKEIDVDAKESKKYEERLQELGVDEQYAEKLEEQYEEETAEEEEENINPEELSEEEQKLSKEELHEKRMNEAKEEAAEAEKEVEGQLDVFFRKLKDLELPQIPPEKVTILENTLNEILATMQDETKETDLDVVGKKMDEAIMIHAPGTLKERYNSEKHDSMIDFYAGFIERAKLAPHRQTLMDIYEGWKAPGSTLTAMNVLGSIENLAAKDNLMKIFDLLEGNEIDPSTDTADEHVNDTPPVAEGSGDAAKPQ